MQIIHSAEAAAHADGMEAARELVAKFVTVDPALLRSAAACLEAKSTDAYSFGFARGLRVIAAEHEENLRRHEEARLVAVPRLRRLIAG